MYKRKQWTCAEEEVAVNNHVDSKDECE